jgi:hypothetical protein
MQQDASHPLKEHSDVLLQLLCLYHKPHRFRTRILTLAHKIWVQDAEYLYYMVITDNVSGFRCYLQPTHLTSQRPSSDQLETVVVMNIISESGA